MRIFISYASQDRARAFSLSERLGREGHSVFIDQSLRSGSRFSLAIGEEIDKSDIVIVLWTRHSVKSRWVLDEADRGRHKLRPVRFGVDAPLGFGSIHAPNLPLLSGVDELLRAIGLGPPVAPRPEPRRWM